MGLQQPRDEWAFLRPDEFADDNSLDELEQRTTRQPEVQAMHVERTRRRRAMRDPGRTDVVVSDDGVDGERAAHWFDDEEPDESSGDGRAGAEPEPEAEPDIEEILESQHYSFEPNQDELAD